MVYERDGKMCWFCLCACVYISFFSTFCTELFVTGISGYTDTRIEIEHNVDEEKTEKINQNEIECKKKKLPQERNTQKKQKVNKYVEEMNITFGFALEFLRFTVTIIIIRQSVWILKQNERIDSHRLLHFQYMCENNVFFILTYVLSLWSWWFPQIFSKC